MQSEYPTIAKRIRYIRKYLGLTQKDFSEALGVGQSTIASIENNINNPSKQIIYNINKQFGIRKEWLISGEGEMEKSNEEIIQEAIKKVNNYSEAEKAFLHIMANINQNNDNKKSNFYKLMHSLLIAYQKADRDTQGYIMIQLKKSFSEFLEK
jgi:transcriptional regulator with XRE-family HTH domain